MGFFAILIIAAAIGPLLGLTTVGLDARAGGRPLTPRRMLAAATIGGALGLTPFSCLTWLGSYGSLAVPLLGLALGALYGFILVGLPLGLRALACRYRDRTG